MTMACTKDRFESTETNSTRIEDAHVIDFIVSVQLHFRVTCRSTERTPSSHLLRMDTTSATVSAYAELEGELQHARDIRNEAPKDAVQCFRKIINTEPGIGFCDLVPSILACFWRTCVA